MRFITRFFFILFGGTAIGLQSIWTIGWLVHSGDGLVSVVSVQPSTSDWVHEWMEMCWRHSGAGCWHIIVQSDFLAGIQCECRTSGKGYSSSSTASAELTRSSQEECIHFTEGSKDRLLPRSKVSFSGTNRISRAPDEMGKKKSSRFLCCWEHHTIVSVRVIQ